jgi:hypothetical protein
MTRSFSWSRCCRGLLLVASACLGLAISAQELAPGKMTEFLFPEAGLTPTLYTMITGTAATPCLTVRLPDDYDPAAKTYPLLVYVPGWHGGPKGNIGNAQEIAGSKGWIVATLPLFKKAIDQSEPAGGLIVSLVDSATISKAYQVMLGRLFERVPNIDRSRSAMVGFSNGALTIAVLVSNNDEFILTHFKNFCLVDHGMFHLMDLHKKGARDSRFLILVGDKNDFGRDLKIRGGQLLQDEMKALGVNLTCRIMKDTGHEFQSRHMTMVGSWLRNEDPPMSTASAPPVTK